MHPQTPQQSTQHSTRRSKKGFMQFLAAQVDRQDKVGIAARELGKKRHWLARLISGGPDPEVLKTGTVRAMVEYDKQLQKRSAR